MENAVGITKPKATAKSCSACRLSKIKCVTADDSCARCTRLGLMCIFEESKRGRQCVSRDKARLGPAVRALLRATTTDSAAEATAALAHNLAVEMEHTYTTDGEVLGWCGDQCQRKMVLSIESLGGRLALLKHWLLIGVHSGNCGTCSSASSLEFSPRVQDPTHPTPHLTPLCRRGASAGLLGNVLLLAHACGVTMDDFALPVARPLQPPSPALQLPPFISEWLESPESLCCVRTQHEGVISWQPNATFVREVGDETMLSAMLETSLPGISKQVRAQSALNHAHVWRTPHAELSPEAVGASRVCPPRARIGYAPS